MNEKNRGQSGKNRKSRGGAIDSKGTPVVRRWAWRRPGVHSWQRKRAWRPETTTATQTGKGKRKRGNRTRSPMRRVGRMLSNSSNRAEGGRASSSGRRQAEAWQALGLASPGGDGGGSDLGGARLTKHDHAHRSGQFSSSLILRLPTLWAHYVRRHLGSSPDDTEYDAVDSLRRQRTESWNLGPVNRQTLYQTATSSDLSTAEDLIVQNVEGGSYPGWLEDSGFLLDVGVCIG
ncbi:hypothetical protein VTN96DRAFT_8272 [Rasamsonia emersonii]